MCSKHNATAGVTLNRSLYETVLRELLLERAEHTVELYEGSGSAWRKVRFVFISLRDKICMVTHAHHCLSLQAHTVSDFLLRNALRNKMLLLLAAIPQCIKPS